MNFGSVCSGIEAASVAWNDLGWKAVWLAEIEPFAKALLAHRYPDVPNLGDMTALPQRIKSREVAAPDVLCGGTPCQAFSIAGLRRSLDDHRGNLSLIFCEIANAIDSVREETGEPPAVIFWENVPGVLSTKDNAFGCFLSGLAGDDVPLVPEPCPASGKSSRYWKWNNKTGTHSLSWPVAGCVTGPTRTVAWRVLDAQYFGVAQRRRRVFVVASAREGFDPAAVLFEFEGVRRDSAPSREAGEGSAGSAARSVALRGREGGATAELGDEVQNCLRASSGGGDKPHVITMAHGQGGAEIGFDRGPTLTCNHEAPIAAYAAPYQYVSNSLCAADGKGANGQHAADHKLVPVAFANVGEFGSLKQVEVSDPLRAKGGDVGNGGESIVCVHGTQDPCVGGDTAFTLGRNNGQENAIAFSCKDYGADAGGQVAVCFAENSRAEARLEGGGDQRTGALSTGGGKPGQGTSVVAVTAYVPEVSATLAARSSRGGGQTNSPGHNADQQLVAQTTMQVRRLTPRECERLQGFQWRCAPDYPGAWQDDAGVWWSPDYTLIPHGRAIRIEKLEDDWIKYLLRGGAMTFEEVCRAAADGPRYKALGNSWAVPNVRWIGRRINHEIFKS